MNSVQEYRKYLLIGLFPVLFNDCSEPINVERSILIFNGYQSNGLDHYQDFVEVNFKLESGDWLWQYEGSDRPQIPSGESRIFVFSIEPERDSIFVHGRFHYQDAVEVQYIQADTVLSLNRNPLVQFWNCGDSTTMEYPFPACFKDYP
ncbi:MAG: hypothetical protein ACE5D2_06400 [Fidelibacterota bacterium]